MLTVLQGYLADADNTDWRVARSGKKYHCGNIVAVEIHFTGVARPHTCLGVLVDSQLTFPDYAKRLAGICCYQLRQLRTVRRHIRCLSKLQRH